MHFERHSGLDPTQKAIPKRAEVEVSVMLKHFRYESNFLARRMKAAHDVALAIQFHHEPVPGQGAIQYPAVVNLQLKQFCRMKHQGTQEHNATAQL